MCLDVPAGGIHSVVVNGDDEAKEHPMAQHTFSVQEIHCEACENAIRKSLSRMDGIRTAEPDSSTNQVSVVYDETTTDEQSIAERLATAGYPVTS
jgi:Cu+-exporting ATPase